MFPVKDIYEITVFNCFQQKKMVSTVVDEYISSIKTRGAFRGGAMGAKPPWTSELY